MESSALSISLVFRYFFSRPVNGRTFLALTQYSTFLDLGTQIFSFSYVIPKCFPSSLVSYSDEPPSPILQLVSFSHPDLPKIVDFYSPDDHLQDHTSVSSSTLYFTFETNQFPNLSLNLNSFHSDMYLDPTDHSVLQNLFLCHSYLDTQDNKPLLQLIYLRALCLLKCHFVGVISTISEKKTNAETVLLVRIVYLK